MSNTISGGISFSGIGSGTDFNEIIAQLKEVESIKLYNLEDSRDVANESYEAYQELLDVIAEAQESLGNLDSPSKFLTKIAASSDEATIGVKADADAVDGTHKVEVKQLASNSIWASTHTYDEKTTVINSTSAPIDFTYSYKGQTQTMAVPPGTTLEGFANMLNENKANPGVQMSLMKTADGYAFQISGKESGADANLQILPSGLLGMTGAAGSWESSSAVDLDAAFTANDKVNTYSYSIKMDNVADPITVGPIAGNASQQELYDTISSAVNDIVPDAVTQDADGNMVIAGLRSIETTGTLPEGATSTITSKVTPTTTFTLPEQVSTEDTYTTGATYTFINADREPVEIAFTEAHSQADIFSALADKGYPVSATTEDTGTETVVTLSGITMAADFLLATPTARDVSMDWPDFTQPVDATANIQTGLTPATFDITFTMADGSTVVAADVSRDSNLRTVLRSNGIPFDDSSGKLVLENVMAVTGIPGSAGISGSATSSDIWAIQASQDAIFKVDNWPQDLTSSTNEVTDVLEGITLTLRDVGTAQITVAADTDSVKDNIQTVLDAVNSVLKKIQDLTAITEDVSPTYDEYGNAGMDTTEGSALTGDYGVQSFAGRLKDAIGNNPPGFQPMTADDIFSGDFISSLAMMGIKVSSDLDSADYGLFTIAPHGSTEEIQAFDQALFDDAITNHLEDVINFFSTDSVGTSSSPNFRYANHIDGLTQPGTYEVSYDIDADGNPYNVMINGVAASKSDLQPNTYSVGNAGGASGMAITIDNLTQGSYSGNVSVQQGKVNQMLDFFAAELKYVEPKLSDPSLGEDNGGLMIAKESYAEQIRSYDEQISEEMERLERWETREKLKYARLDTLLGDYNGNMEILNQQLAQLG